MRRYDLIKFNEKFYFVTKLNRTHRITVQEESNIKAEPKRVKSSSGKEYNRKETIDLTIDKLAGVFGI